MAKFSTLASELLAHILHLSTEGEDVAARQRARFSFGLISRACYLATADATDFYVAGQSQANELILKLEREASKVKSGRTMRSSAALTRLTTVRRLRFDLDWDQAKVLASLLRMTPDLIELELNGSRAGLGRSLGGYTPSELEPLVVPLGKLAHLRVLRLASLHLQITAFARIVNPIKALETLDWARSSFPQQNFGRSLQNLENPLRLFNLVNIHFVLRESHVQFRSPAAPNPLARLGDLATTSTAGIRTLDLGTTPFYHTSLPIIQPLLALVSSVSNLTWTPVGAGPWNNDQRDATLVLLGAMKNLQRVEIALWLVDISNCMFEAYDSKEAVDHSLLDTLAALPSLRIVKLVASVGILDEKRVSLFLDSCSDLRYLIIKVPTNGWTREQIASVQGASEKAGVTFAYEGTII